MYDISWNVFTVTYTNFVTHNVSNYCRQTARYFQRMKLVTFNNDSAIIACHQGQFHTPNANSKLDIAIKPEH
jgi:hypothetical protein